MSKRAIVLIILFFGLAVGWFLMSEDNAEKIVKKKTVEKIKTKEKEKVKRPTSEHEVPARKAKNAPPLTSDEAQMMLIGIWRIDLDSLRDDPEVKNTPKEERAEALRMAKSMMQNVAFEFTQDKKMNLFMSSQVRRGTYSVTGAKDNLLTVTTTNSEDGTQKTIYEVRVFAEALELTDLKNKVTRRLIRGSPPMPSEAPAQP